MVLGILTAVGNNMCWKCKTFIPLSCKCDCDAQSLNMSGQKGGKAVAGCVKCKHTVKF